MSYPRKLYIQWNILFADVVLLSGVFHFYLIQQAGNIQVNYLPWLLALTLALVINTLLRAKSAPVNLVIILNIAMAVGIGIWGQGLLHMNEEAFMPRMFFFILLAASTAHSALLVQDEPKQNQIILYLDIQVIATAFIMTLQHIGTFTEVEQLVTFCQASCLSTLFALILFRLQLPHREHTTGRQVTGAIMLGIFFLIILLLALFASSHSQGASESLVHLAVWIKDQLVAVLLFLVQLLSRFLMWLMSLFPAPETEMILPEQESGVNMEEMAAEAVGNGGIVILIILGILIASAFFYLLYRLHGHRWQREAKHAPPKGTAKRRNDWKNGFSALWKKIVSRIRFEIAYIRNRKTASGLLVWTERKLRRKGYKRGKDESPSTFLRRLAAAAALQEASAVEPIITELANILEKQYYKRTVSILPDGFYKDYRRTLNQFSHI